MDKPEIECPNCGETYEIMPVVNKSKRIVFYKCLNCGTDLKIKPKVETPEGCDAVGQVKPDTK